MNFEQLRTFLEIAATGNFNRAADNLNVTQSTVSARIKALEDRLDRKLFSRGRNGVEPTAAGHQFHRYALAMVRTWEGARQEIALPGGFRTVIGLGSQVSLWERLILKWIPWMRQAAPDVALHLEADYSDSLMRQLSDGLLDIGVMYRPRNAPGLVIEKLLEENLVLVSTERVKSPDAWPEGYIAVDWGYDFRGGFSQAFPDVQMPAITVGLGSLGLQYVLENGGAGYFPMRVVRPLIAGKRLFRVPKAPTFKRPAYVVFPADPYNPDLRDLALDGLRRIVRLEKEN